jgi:hypothetical protein
MTLSRIGLSTALIALSMSFAALSAQAAGVKTEARDLQSSKPNISGILWDGPTEPMPMPPSPVPGCGYDDYDWC